MAESLPAAMMIEAALSQRVAPSGWTTERRLGPSKRAAPLISSTPFDFSSIWTPPLSFATISALRAAILA